MKVSDLLVLGPVVNATGELRIQLPGRNDLSFLEVYSTIVFYQDFELIIFMISQCLRLKPLMVDITSRMLVPALSMRLLLADYMI